MSDSKNKPGGKSSTSMIIIWVAVIGLIGTLGAAVIANWDKIFPPETTVNKIDTKPKAISTLNPKVEIQKLAFNWYSALCIGDVETVINLSSNQFYFDTGFVTKPELKELLNEILVVDKPDFGPFNINSFNVYSIQELMSQRKNDYAVASSILDLTINDYAIVDREDNFPLLIARQNQDVFEVITVIAY